MWLKDYPILLVDDEPTNLLVLRTELEDEFTVLTAGSGDEALDILSHCDVAVLVTDQRMPSMSGTELCEFVQADHPGVYRMILTAYADLRSSVDAINRGRVHAYLVKPWTAKTLRQRILEAISARRVEKMTTMLTSALDSRARLLTGAQEGRRIRHDMRSIANAGRLATELAIEALDARSGELSGDLRGELLDLLDGAMRSFDYIEALRKRASRAAMEERNPEPVRITELLQALKPLLPSRRGVKLTTAAAPHLWVDVDRVSVGRIVINLVANAMDALAGPGHVSVVAAEAGANVHIDVTDDGPGVPADLRERVFEIMFTTRATTEGHGFGLAICRQLAAKERGALQLVDRDGPGATFRLILPLDRAGEEHAGDERELPQSA